MKYLIKTILSCLLVTSVYSAEIESTLAVNNASLFTSLRKLHREHVGKIDSKWIDLLRYYRAFFKSGESLKKRCKDTTRVYYRNAVERDSAKMALISELQLIILHESIPAIAEYSKKLELTNEQYTNLYESLINESCSQNITVMSHRLIRKKFLFGRDKTYKLPSLKGNVLFDKTIQLIQSKEQKIFQELYYTIGLFKAACSWGNRHESLRMLGPLINNEVITAYLIRQFSNNKLERFDNFGIKILKKSNQTLKTYCDGFICREIDDEMFKRKFPRGIGSTNIRGDLESIYCQGLRGKQEEKEIGLDSAFLELEETYGGDESYRMISQFISLITKFPDFNVWAQDKYTLDRYMKLSMNKFFNMWALQGIDKASKDLNYEEPLILKIVNGEKFQELSLFSPKIVMDINSGEFDKSVSVNGKLKYSYVMKIYKKDLYWIFYTLKTSNYSSPEYKRADKLLRTYVDEAYIRFKGPLSEYIIKGDVRNMIHVEFRSQLLFFSNAVMQHQKGDYFSVPIEFNIGTFALTYIKNKKLMRRNLNKEIQRHKRFELTDRIDSMADDEKE